MRIRPGISGGEYARALRTTLPIALLSIANTDRGKGPPTAARIHPALDVADVSNPTWCRND
jgi:hypothetical protein